MTSVVGSVIEGLLRFYSILIFVYVILSWFPVGRGGLLADIYRVLASVCEPYIGIFRRIVPVAGVGGAGVDFSPLVALLVLNFLIQPAVARLVAMLAL